MGRTRQSRALLALAALCVGTGVASWLLPAAGAAPADDAADAAVAWLAGEADDGVLSYLGAPEWGLTADSVLAHAAAGSAGAAATRSTDQLAANASTFITFGAPAVRSAGALAKLLLVAEVMGRDVTAFGGWNLRSELSATLTLTAGPNLGRFSDVGIPDASNVYGQALAVLALARTGGAPAEAVSFLIAQQCPGDGFRAFFPSGGGCTTAAAADGDTTAVAVQALLAAGTPEAVAAAEAGGDDLVGRQLADGSVGGSGPTAAANANSTALAAQALDALGRPVPAAAAREWLVGLQLGCDSGDAGAIAYHPTAFAAASASGIPAGSRDQFRRTTAQAALGLAGVPLTTLSATGIRPEALPTGCEVSPTSSTTTAVSPTTTSTSVAPPPPPPATPTTAVGSPGPTTTVAAGPPSEPTVVVAAPPDPGPGDPPPGGTVDDDADVLAGTAGGASAGLAFTGAAAGPATLLGVALLGLGVAAAAVALHGGRRR